MNNTITIDNVPEGFELTGEFRTTLDDEWGLFDGKPLQTWSSYPVPILRKVWQPQKWMQHYKGCWLFLHNSGGWVVSKTGPWSNEVGNFKRYFLPPYHVMFNAVHIAELHGDEFTPPTHTTCLQIQ